MKRFGRALAVILGIIVLGSVATRSFKTSAQDRCRPVAGTIRATAFRALNVAPSAGMPITEPSANLAYSGELTIMTGLGTLVTHDLDVLDASHLAFTEIERPASGTGVFANPGNSVFVTSGSIVNNGAGFQGNLSGMVCADDN